MKSVIVHLILACISNLIYIRLLEINSTKKKNMITVHHLNESRSKRVIWLLEELQVPYDLVKHQRDITTHLAPESLKKIHPLAKAPIIIDGNFTLCESGAVMEYILDNATQKTLRPEANTTEYYQYLEWLHFAEGSLSLPLITSIFLQGEDRDGSQALDGYIAKELELDFSYIESTLSDRAFFAGNDFSAADIMMTFMLEVASKLGILTGRKNTQAFLEKVQGRKAYQFAASLG
jgi:glutathione S-transferase